MKNFKQDRRPSGRKDFGGGRGFGQKSSGGRDFGGRDNRDRERPQMHRATCADCGKSCEVPFKPTGDRPVLCSDCFGGSRERSRETSRRPERNSFQRSSFDEKQMFSAVCAECGDDCEVPFKPSDGRPVLCSDCFGGSSKSGRSENGANSKFQEQLDAINGKLDKILRTLAAAPVNDPVQDGVVKVKVEKAEAKKIVKKSEAVKENKAKKPAKKIAVKKKK